MADDIEMKIEGTCLQWYKGNVEKLVVPEGITDVDCLNFGLAHVVFPESVDFFRGSILPYDGNLKRITFYNLDQAGILANYDEGCYMIYITNRNLRLAYHAHGRDCNTEDLREFCYDYDPDYNSDLPDDEVEFGKRVWEDYDYTLINNGPHFKFVSEVRVFGAINRLCDPIFLKDEYKAAYIDYLKKKAKKVVELAEYDKDPRYIRVMIDEGIINGSNKNEIKELLNSSTVPEIKQMANEIPDSIEVKKEKTVPVSTEYGIPAPKGKKIYVKAKFPNNKTYLYWCPYKVSVGDTVFVDGALENLPGTVVEIVSKSPSRAASHNMRAVINAYNAKSDIETVGTNTDSVVLPVKNKKVNQTPKKTKKDKDLPKAVQEMIKWIDTMQPFTDGSLNPENFADFLQDLFDQKKKYEFDKKTGVFSFVVNVVGTQYEGRNPRIERIKEGDAVKIVREPDNKFNSKNLSVRNARGESLGNLGADDAEYISPVLDTAGYVIRNSKVASVIPKSQRGPHAKISELYVSFEVVEKGSLSPEKEILAKDLDATGLSGTGVPDQSKEITDEAHEVISNRRFSYERMQKASGQGYEILIPDEFDLNHDDSNRDFTATTSLEGFVDNGYSQITFYSSVMIAAGFKIPDRLLTLKNRINDQIKESLSMMELLGKSMGATKKPVATDISTDSIAGSMISIKTKGCFYHYPQVVTSFGIKQFRVDMLTEKLGMSFEESIDYVKDLMSTIKVELEFKDSVIPKVPSKSPKESKPAHSTRAVSAAPVAKEETVSIFDPNVQPSFAFDEGNRVELNGMVLPVPDGFSVSQTGEFPKMYKTCNNGISNSPFVIEVDSVEKLDDCDSEQEARVALFKREKTVIDGKKTIDGYIPCESGSILYRIMVTKHAFTVLYVIPGMIYAFNVVTKPKYGFSQAVADIRSLLEHVVIKEKFKVAMGADDESFFKGTTDNEVDEWKSYVKGYQQKYVELKELDIKHLKYKNKKGLVEEQIYKSEIQKINNEYKDHMNRINAEIYSVVKKEREWPLEKTLSFYKKTNDLICEEKGVDSSCKEEIKVLIKQGEENLKAQKEAALEAARQERINSRVNPRLVEVVDNNPVIPNDARDRYKKIAEQGQRDRFAAKKNCDALLTEYPEYSDLIWLKMLLELGGVEDSLMKDHPERIIDEYVDWIFEALDKGSKRFTTNKLKLLYSIADQLDESFQADFAFRLLCYDFDERDDLLSDLINRCFESGQYDVIGAAMLFLKLPEEQHVFIDLYERCYSREDDNCLVKIHEIFTGYDLTGFPILDVFDRYVETMKSGQSLNGSGVDLMSFSDASIYLIYIMLIDHIVLCSDYYMMGYLDDLIENIGIPDGIRDRVCNRIIDDCMKKADSLYKKKKYEEVYKMMNSVLKIDPENITARYYLCRLDKAYFKKVEYLWDAEGFDEVVDHADINLIKSISNHVKKDSSDYDDKYAQDEKRVQTMLEDSREALVKDRQSLIKWKDFIPNKHLYGNHWIFFILTAVIAVFNVFLYYYAKEQERLMGQVDTGFLRMIFYINIIMFFVFIIVGITTLVRNRSNLARETEKKKKMIADVSKQVEQVEQDVVGLTNDLNTLREKKNKKDKHINKLIYKRVEYGLSRNL